MRFSRLSRLSTLPALVVIGTVVLADHTSLAQPSPKPIQQEQVNRRPEPGPAAIQGHPLPSFNVVPAARHNPVVEKYGWSKWENGTLVDVFVDTVGRTRAGVACSCSNPLWTPCPEEVCPPN